MTIRTFVLIVKNINKGNIFLDTREAILNTALLLFNKRGAYSITTRHISAEMKISPGNLYYHYRNKEEIIRQLLKIMTDDFSNIYKNRQQEKNQPINLNEIVNSTGNIIYNYRFFYAEIATLLDKDPLLRKMYNDIKADRFNDFKNIFASFADMGIFVNRMSEDDFTCELENIWSMSEFIIQSMQINGIKITRDNISISFRKIMHILKPYIKKEVWNKLL